MSYSVSNVDSLRYIYCDANLESSQNWEHFKTQISTISGTYMDVCLTDKYKRYYVTLLDNVVAFFDSSKWSEYRECENEMLYHKLSRWKRNDLATSLRSLAVDLTHSFRHEILRLSEQGRENLAYEHSKIILACIKKSKGDIAEEVKRSLIPDPKQEIHRRIDAYIKERKGRHFRSTNDTRENFLRDFKSALDSPNVNLKELIDRISQRVLFKDDWIDWMINNKRAGLSLSEHNKSLNYLNPFIQSLRIYQNQSQPTTNVDETRHHFSNPFFTACCHISMKQTLEDVLLLLMRLHVTQITNQNGFASQFKNRSVSLITTISNSIRGEFHSKIAQLSIRLDEIVNEREEKARARARWRAMKEMESPRLDGGGGGDM